MLHADERELAKLGSDFYEILWKISSVPNSLDSEYHKNKVLEDRIEEEKREKLSKIVPLPHSVYLVEATKLDEKLICYINVMKWERIKYPEPDKPISVSHLLMS